MIEAVVKKTGGVPSNYAIILFGLLFFPIQIVAMLFAKRRLHEGDDWERSHYQMQYRSAAAYLVIEAAVFGIKAATLFLMHGKISAEVTSLRTWLVFTTFAGYVPLAWLAIRCVRGLFLAGAKTPLVNPRSYTIWPR
ncbi:MULTISPECIES: hypothetical protein [Rhizobium]|uniref:Putative membrane protein n=1 Tax=Rhizobium paranaense TaxID=1650438 RepID=A0A7W8XLT3_9HYPH|nr:MULTISPECIES: hypothetical protein [Rhizobium]MBB5571737.1 putative membrane protein [Rhizobium paranaense]PST63817.1 hypothetical protein C9E91_05565 [Rhizobium sp. SEMIA4064]